ncbi:serine hydrolase [Frigoribacterium sp. PhB24]|uniref:serine hydrolase domain-containing protein n=1 Tax=Frigoribacterium sp. PhB24 TaxID=2485204 RepID=UPI000F4621B0|nr:serine hydrolase domain-containing protein [Frigoribacterium sp. PhB24]ROS52782.1 CubicO group peptidase (beta-lactamase class C family) [Frigoribacterium sp. PhB24]
MTTAIHPSGPDAPTGIDAVFAARRPERRGPSAVWATFDRTGMTHDGSYGEIAPGTAPGVDTAYRIASCTKSFTATALLAQRDAGLVSLDAPISDFVPAFADVALPTADSPTPTLRMLLTMSAGFPTDDPWGDRQESLTDDELDALLRAGLSFDSVPGTTFAYSNLGFALVGRAIAAVAGRPYREVVESTILGPLGLEATGFEATVPAAGGIAIGHRRASDGGDALPFSGPGAFSPIGGLFSTVTDLTRWARWLGSAFDPEGRGDLDGILSRASRREMQQVQRFVPARAGHPGGYGFGLFVEHYPDHGTVVSHSGGYPGFSAHMRWQTATGLGAIGFENATYSKVSEPIGLALDGVMADRSDARVIVAPWPETTAARATVEAVVRGGDVPDGLFSDNVELDLPLDRRRTSWAAVVDSVGGWDDTGDATPADESTAPSHLVWRRRGTRGVVRFEIRLTPERPPRVQAVLVSAESPR